MPTFNAYLPAGKFSIEQKRALADALNVALHESLGTPMEDRFIIISEHGENEFFTHPTFPDLNRSDKRIVVTVVFGEGRPVEEKRKLAELITKYTVENPSPVRH